MACSSSAGDDGRSQHTPSSYLLFFFQSWPKSPSSISTSFVPTSAVMISSSQWWFMVVLSSRKDANYKRTIIACFIQAVYLLVLDRQEKRTQENALAPNWWIPFKYKLKKTLIDERDGSIFGAILEWDQSAAFADLVLIRPSGAPKAVLVLRGTLLKIPTMKRDIEDDLRFLAWESLKGSVRFKVALDALKSVCDAYGGSNVCIAGHSLCAGFALQVGKVLAKEGINVETHFLIHLMFTSHES